METQDKSLPRFADLLGQLGPGRDLLVALSILRSVFATTIGESIGNVIERARTFAEEQGCVFRYEAQKECGVFGRAYFKKFD